MRTFSKSAAVLLLALLLGIATAADEATAALQAKFDAEKDAGRKAKLFRKLGDLQFESARQAASRGDFSWVGFTMEKYRDNLRVTLDALKHQKPDADRHANSYKDLEISVSKHVRAIGDQILAAPEEFRPPLQIVQRDVASMEDELLHIIFPLRPGEKPLPSQSQPQDKRPGSPQPPGGPQ